LAHRLLGADVRRTPVEPLAGRLPDWLARTVLKQWRFPNKEYAPDNLPMLTLLRRHTGIKRALRYRWPNAIEATYGLRGPYTRWPRVPYQMGLYLARAVRFQARLPQLLRRES